MGTVRGGQRVLIHLHHQLPPQGHLQSLEGTVENQQALILGLDYLVNLSYVDNIEVGVGGSLS